MAEGEEPAVSSPVARQGRKASRRTRKQAVGLREVDCGELDPALHQVRDEGDVAGEAIQLCDDEGRIVQPAEAEGLGELRAIIALTALDLDSLSDEAPVPAVEVSLKITDRKMRRSPAALNMRR